MTNNNLPSYWKDIQIKKNTNELIFIHTPKTGGSYVNQILQDLKIKNYEHNQASPNEKSITFTIIRDPVKRFESLINYRLGEINPRGDWPQGLRHVYKNKSIGINKIINKMSKKEILNFSPYRTLSYWTKNIDICISIDKLQELLHFFGYKIDLSLYVKKNVSKKERGTFNKDAIKKLSNIYRNDIILYNQKVGSKVN
tara:strand:+ start:2459 stop:3052 length:594 start_codon:yes stop_codon:yes gene_type:complete